LRHRAAALLRLLLLLPSLAFASEALSEKRIALVIGNSAYAGAPLANPINDAKAIANKLQELGFEVVMKSNASQRDMTRALSDFGERITPGSIALFYYAGHGIQARGKNFLIPVDADIRNENAISSEAVDVDRVLEQVGGAGLSMVVLDACRNNPFERRFRSAAGRGLAQIEAPAGSLIAYATAPGKVALDGDRGHGPYTEALLRAMDTPGLRVEDVFKQVRIQVLKITGNQQIPWEASSLTGEFLFRPAQVVVDTARIQAERDAAAVREQLKTLSAEMTALRESQARALAARAVPEPRKIEQESTAMRDQLASLAAEIAVLRQAQPASGSPATRAPEQRKAEQEVAALREQLANLATDLARRQDGAPAPTLAPPRFTEVWSKQLAKLRAARGKLSFASAIEQLLEVTAREDVAALRSFESTLNRRAYSSAFALGVDAAGIIAWGGTYNYSGGEHAANATAVDFCKRVGAASCNIVVKNGSFDENAFLEFAGGLASQPVEVVRKALMDTMRRPVIETAFRRGTAGGGGEWFGYTATP
jgi:uncharacterized caspase-like protein